MDSASIARHHLPAADPSKTLDFVRLGIKGALFGVIGGMGIIAMLELIKPYSFDLSAGLYWVPMLMTACFGCWLGIMTGLETPHAGLAPLQSKIQKGRVVVMVDVTTEHLESVKQELQKRVPQAKFEQISDLIEPLFQDKASKG